MKWSGLVTGVTVSSQNGEPTAAIFVHGLFSSAGVWRHFDQLIRRDPELSHLTILNFEYSSPKLNWSPLRGIPDFNVLADNLQTYLEVEAPNHSNVVLVSHSQGGLIVQRFLSRMISKGRGDELARIRRVVMFACPNSGSEVLLTTRRGAIFWRHPQERDLRPINASVNDAQQIVLSRIVHASSIGADECHIPIVALAGESDNIVTPTSARSVFPDTGVLPGDHFSIIRPDSLNHRAYTTLKKNLLMLPWGHRSTPEPEAITGDRRGARTGISPNREDSFLQVAPNFTGAALADQTSISVPGADVDEMSRVIARWNPRERTLDFIMSPEIALAWVKKLEEDESTDG